MTNEELLLAQDIARYYRQPELTSYYEKERLFAAIARNRDLHFEALDLNRRFWRSRRKVGR